MVLKHKQQGQGLSEYIIIVALIAVAAIGVVSLFGGTISNQISGMAMEMSGQNGDQQITEAGQDASASEAASQARGLSTYNDGNTGAHQGGN